jgi:ABC-type multidrug transport system ATPase subunit/ABC-type multidrug transport system permease subunit
MTSVETQPDQEMQSFSSFSMPMSWNNLQYTAGDRKILRGLTGTALPSRTLAVMGSSGAGKTTFLNALSDRLLQNQDCVLTGTTQIADLVYEHRYRKLLGYVTQEDIIGALDTPKTALSFSLRIRRGFSAEETAERVKDTLTELNLLGCQDTIVGIPGVISGLSGGERKRCNIGIELINDTKILLLDEPTSGLDSVTSVKIISSLREISRKGRTVIYTLHQPTAEALSFFDDLMLMALGKAVYHGPMDQAVDYFSSLGYVCPDTHTPTDYFMTLLQDENIAPKLVELWEERIALKQTSSELTTCPPVSHDPKTTSAFIFAEDYIKHTGSSLSLQFQELTKRATSQMVRNKMYMFMTFVQAVFFGLIAGLIFIKLGSDTTSLQDRYGLLFMVATNTAFNSAITMINTFPKDKAVYIREQQAGAYSPFLYMITKMFAELPVQLLGTLLQCTIIYLLAQLHQDAGSFFYFFAVNALLQQVTGGLGFAISASVDSYVVASGLAPMCIVPTLLVAGLFAHTSRLRPYWYWLEKVAFTRHAFILLVRNEIEHLDHISCDQAKYGDYCTRAPRSGADAFRQIGIDGPEDAPWAMWVSLAVLFVIFRLIVWAALVRVAKSQM